MPRNFSRPDLPYINISLPNDKRYQLLTRSNKRPPTDIMIDSDFDYIIDALNILDIAMDGISLGALPGVDVPDNADKLLTTDGGGNSSWVFVQASNILDQSITGNKLFPQTITAVQLADGGVPATKLAPNAVTTIKIVDLNVTSSKLAPDSVVTDKIADDAITTDKIEDGAITAVKMANSSVETAALVNNSVTLAKLAQEVIDRLVPVGTVVEFAGTVGFSANWLECNGQAVSRVTYATLFVNLGTTYGVGDGATTFNLPDRRGRVGVGIGSDNSTGGRITGATATDIALGKTFGSETVTLDITQIPSHNHSLTVTEASFSGGIGSSTWSVTAPSGITTGNTGGGLPHVNTQPSIFTRYYIRAL